MQTDLATNHVARYNWITPNEFNDMHSPLPGGYVPLGGGPLLSGNDAMIRQGDDFLKQVLPQIMASKAYQDNGAIILWWDESEKSDSYVTTIPEIVISPLAHPNVNGVPYASAVNLSHSSDLRTMQEIFHVGTQFLGDAANMPDPERPVSRLVRFRPDCKRPGSRKGEKGQGSALDPLGPVGPRPHSWGGTTKLGPSYLRTVKSNRSRAKFGLKYGSFFI